MTHLKQIDGRRHTVILVQVENETGIYGSDRDYSPAANRAFAKQVPAALRKTMHKPAGTWREVFGRNAAEYFEAWYTARYVGRIAAAGKAVYGLPMYANASLRSPPPFDPEPPASGGYNSGGPTGNVLDI
jgi:beta-galactosidase GanA